MNDGKLTHGSLFSGIGGFDLAAEWMGWENIFHCEWNEFGQRVLKHYWPNAISYEDITKTDLTIHRGRIDVLTGGFPCQPYSMAGKRLGKEDERHLWPEMLRAIREIQPRWVVGENVRGLVNWNGGLVFDEVQADLEAAGYEVQPFILPACGKDAPHRRERVWFVAYTEECGNLRRPEEISSESKKEWLQKPKRVQQLDKPSGLRGSVANATGKGLQGSKEQGIIERGREERNEQFAGLFQPTWENFPTQPPICGRNDGLPAQLDGITFPKWRQESIKAYGNAVVPQVVYEIFKAIMSMESKLHTEI